MSYRYGSSMLPGSYHYGGGGLGIRGDLIPSSGVNGPSYLFNDLTLPADAAVEVRGLILSPPVVGNWFAWPDGRFSFLDAPDGVYTIPYRLYSDGVEMEPIAYIMIVQGGAGSVLSGNATLDGFTTSGVLASGAVGASDLSGNADLDSLITAGQLYGDMVVNLNQDYPGWVVRTYSRGGYLGRP